MAEERLREVLTVVDELDRDHFCCPDERTAGCFFGHYFDPVAQAEVPMAPNLLIHSPASLTPGSRSCFFPFASVMTTFTDREGYGL
jgi:hypothetical protein